MNAEDYADVIRNVAAELHVPSTDRTLIRNVSYYSKGLDLRGRSFATKDARNAAVAKMYVDSLSPSTTPFDFEAYARKVSDQPRQEDIGRELSALTTWISENMPVVASKSMGVYIDSRVCRSTSSTGGITDFEFRVAPRHTHNSGDNGHVVTNEVPTMVTYFKIPRIMLPYSENLRQRNCTNEITLTFTGLRSSGILAHEDTYHFVFSYDPSKNSNSSIVELVPVIDCCKFSPPLRIVDDLSLRFNDPVYPIHFAPDRLRPVSINYNSTEGRIVFDVPHGISSGDVVVVDGLVTRNDTVNSQLLKQINDPRGIVVYEIDTYVIAININLSRFKLTEATSLPWVLLIGRTFRFPLEIGYQGGE